MKYALPITWVPLGIPAPHIPRGSRGLVPGKRTKVNLVVPGQQYQIRPLAHSKMAQLAWEHRSNGDIRMKEEVALVQIDAGKRDSEQRRHAEKANAKTNTCCD